MAKARAFGAAALAAIAFVAIAAWPQYVERAAGVARAASLPTPAPVTADYRERDRLVAFWERAAGERHRSDMISPAQLAGQYLQRYRETGDVDDVLRAERAARASLAAQPIGNRAGALQLASVELTLHRFREALAITEGVEAWDRGNDGVYVDEASLDLELGDYAAARRRLDGVPARRRGDGWRVIESRYLELTGRLDDARNLLAIAAAYQNAVFDAPAQRRAWYFFRQGEMAFEAGDADAAIGFERRAAEIFPGYADAYRALARIECARRAWEACLRDATRSADRVPYPETLGYEADAKRALGDATGAAATEDLIDAIRRIGDAQRISDRLLAIYEADHGRHVDEAYRIARGELAIRDDIYTEDTLAWAAAMSGRWTEARRASAKATRLGTHDAILWYHAGVIAQHFGDAEGARRLLARALEDNPAFHAVYADDARARLARLP